MTRIILKLLPRNRLSVITGAAALFLGLSPAVALIGTEFQMQLGNPSGATADPTNHAHYLIQRTVEAIDYSDNHGQPNWASWDLTSGDVGSSGRSDAWAVDTNLPPGFYPVPIDTFGSYNGTSYDRGHMCPSGDRTTNTPINELVFIMSNIIPQASAQNEGVWANLEDYCRSLISTQELLITCGPSGFSGALPFDSGHVALASNTWKIAVSVPLGSGSALSRLTNANPGSIRVIAVEIPNTDAAGSSPWTSFVTSTKQVQIDTGFTFFTALPSNLAWVLRSKVDGQAAAAPGFTSFAPPGGPANTSVTITGTNLDSTTNVYFNGTSATYTINSPTQVVAIVPAGASSGLISLKTLGGTAASSTSFDVGTGGGPDLAIAKTHSGNFTQGDLGDTYTIVVTNVGTAASSGTVTVIDALPIGLTASGIDGNGWTCTLSNLTCTRSDNLAAGAGYPPITVTVNVAIDAPASLTNLAAVSGGADANATNNTASDPTTIDAVGAPTATTGSATVLGTTTATLNGTVNPNGLAATVQFQYGLTASYGSNAAVAGTLTGTTPQPVSASLTGLTPGTTYHFHVSATNAAGTAVGLDQTFTTTAPDLALAVNHSGNFSQGDLGDTYTIIVTNVGTAASTGTVTVTDTLPVGLTASGINGTGWTCTLSNLTCTCSDALAAGGAYPPITLTVNVSASAPASLTNTATVSGGGENSTANDTASDPTTVNPAAGGSTYVGVLAGWDVNGLPGGANNFGPSPLSPTTNAPNLAVGGLTRGSGVGTSGTGAQRGWGGNDFTATNAVSAVNSNDFATFSLAANPGYKVSYTTVTRFDYRRSPTGPTNGVLQYQIGSGAFADIAALSYPSNTAAGGSLNAIDLSGIPALQNVGAGTTITFRIVNWGATSSAGTWYIFDVTNSSALDFIVQGTVIPLTPIQAWRLQYFGKTDNSGAAADAAIATSDGMPNLLKYALGLDPLVPATNPVVGDITTGYLRLTAPRNPNATDVTFGVEIRDNLTAASWTANGTTVDQNTPTLFRAHDNTPVDSSSNGFIRLRVTRP